MRRLMRKVCEWPNSEDGPPTECRDQLLPPQPFPRQGQTGGDPVLAAGIDGQLLATLGSVADSTTGIALAGIATVCLAHEIAGCSAK